MQHNFVNITSVKNKIYIDSNGLQVWIDLVTANLSCQLRFSKRKWILFIKTLKKMNSISPKGQYAGIILDSGKIIYTPRTNKEINRIYKFLGIQLTNRPIYKKTKPNYRSKYDHTISLIKGSTILFMKRDLFIQFKNCCLNLSL